MIDRDITLTCVSESVGGNYVGNARWQGTLLAPILRKAGVHRGADQIVMRDVHGMTIGVATDPVLDGRDSLLAVAMNGEVLPQAHGYPVRVVVPGSSRSRPGRSGRRSRPSPASTCRNGSATCPRVR
jgi:DMSO/TMAO reductase YedYZ molybdopterin-dependent catalytic subunit